MTAVLTPSLIDELIAAVGREGVLTAEADRMVYECDGYTIDKAVPDVVVLPNSTEQVVAVVNLCRKYDLPIVPRGAGSSLAGGAIPLGGGVLISLTRMNRILEIDVENRMALVEPGVVVVSTGREGGKFVVRGLRDPLARNPAALLPSYNLAGDEVFGRWELYQALHPALVLARARQVLAPPPGVNLQLEQDALVASGTAPIDWIDTSLRIAPAIAGVTRLDAGRLIDSSVDALARSIEDGIPMFVKGSTAFIPGGEQIVRAQIALPLQSCYGSLEFGARLRGITGQGIRIR